MTKVAIISNGCIKEDAYQGNFIKLLEKNNIKQAENFREANYLLYITCAGTGSIIKREIDELSNYIPLVEHYNKKIFIVGCLTKIESLFQNVKNDKNVKIIKNENWLVPVMNDIKNENHHNSINTILANNTRDLFNSNARVQFFIERGCINKCSFCKINYLGNSVSSIPYDKALDYLRKLIRNGTKEITLSGENTTIYGIDLYHKPIIHQLIHEISLEENLERIRLNEVTVQNMYPELLNEIINNNKINFVSMQLESGSDKILNLMDRKYTLKDYDKVAKEIIDSGKYLSTVLMSGFPKETYDDLDITSEYIKERGILTEFICEYQNASFIPSGQLEQIPTKLKHRHTNYLKKIVRKNNQTIRQKYVDNNNRYMYLGKDSSDNFVFSSDIDSFGFSKNEKFKSLIPGDTLNIKAKRLVKSNGYNSKIKL